MALATAITRTAVVQAAQAGPNNTVQVGLAIQPTAAAAGSQANLLLSASEWQEIVGETTSGGVAGIGVFLTVTIQ
jgi:hypothetical protein